MERKIIDAVIYKRQKINLIKYVRIWILRVWNKCADVLLPPRLSFRS
jgi:hypothetical protein